MKISLSSGIMLTLLFVGMLMVSFDVQPVEAGGTVYIRADGSIDPPTANITTVDNGTYTFTADVYDSIVVERDNIVVDGAGYTVLGTGSGRGIDLSGRSNVTIENVEVTGFTWGMWLKNSNNNVLSGNNASSNHILGIYLNSSSYNNLTGNTASSNNQHGIYLHYSNHNTLTSNTASSNYYYNGIWLKNSNNNTLTGNTASNNGRGILLLESSNNVLTDNIASSNNVNFAVLGSDFSDFNNYVNTSNTVDDKSILYLIGVADAVYDAKTNAGVIYLINCNNITLKDSTLTKNIYGVMFWNTTDSKIENVTASNNQDGIYLGYHSNNNNLTGNNASSNWSGGIYLDSSSHNNLTGNIASSNEGIGIYLHYSNHNTLTSNTASSSKYQTGICLSYSSDNILTGNTVSNNFFSGIAPSSSSNNLFFHNNLINNIQVWSSNSTNDWDNGYPSGGNYWSDYTGIDAYGGPYQNETGSDGIGDTPYVINANNTDGYPLMDLYRGPYDIGITNVTTTKTVVGQGYNLNVSVETMNYGINTESFNVTVYANTSSIAALTNIALPSGNSTTTTLTWNTTGFDKGNYTLSASVTRVSGEWYITDNTYTNGWIFVTTVGDVDGDRDVDVGDQRKVQLAMFSEPGALNWNPNMDVDSDLDVDVGDQRKQQLHMFESW